MKQLIGAAEFVPPVEGSQRKWFKVVFVKR